MGGSAPQVRPSPHGLAEEVPHFQTSLIQRVRPACTSLPVLTMPLFAQKRAVLTGAEVLDSSLNFALNFEILLLI